MYTNLEKKASAKDLYSGSGRQVEQAYRNLKKESKNRAEILEAMKNKMEEIGPEKISKHMGDFSERQVADIADNLLPKDKKDAFQKALSEDKRIDKYISPPKDPAHHVEIPQPNKDE